MRGGLTEKEKARYRAAEAAGLMQRLEEVGWAGLTSAESGRIGGVLSGMTRRGKKQHG
ncbi:MAG: hypothetical protein MR021_07680 [Clostridiales bacterium]|nr:hypothetical protein [Clostridiales bacterium]